MGLLQDARSRGFVYYSELALYTVGLDLDDVLLQLEKGGIAICPDAQLASHEAPREPDDASDDFPDDDPVRVYLWELSKVPHLTSEQENELSRTIALKGIDAESAKKDLLEANLSLVATIAQQYRIRGVHLLDLMVHGNSALLNAAETFDFARGYSFTTYAMFSVHRAAYDLGQESLRRASSPRSNLPV